MAADDAYDIDFYAWTKAQAEALREHNAGNNALDYENLAEEIESLGRSQRRACESLITLIIEHLLKIEHLGADQAQEHWRKEVRAFRKRLSKELTPSLTAKLPDEIETLYADVRDDLAELERLKGWPKQLPVTCPYDWSQIVDLIWFPEAKPARLGDFG